MTKETKPDMGIEVPGQEFMAVASMAGLSEPEERPAETLPFEEDEVSELLSAGLRQIHGLPDHSSSPMERGVNAVSTDLINLESLYAQRGLWEDFVSILNRRIAVSEGTDRIAYMLELARLLEAQFQDFERAIALYHRILELLPTCQPAFARLMALLTRSEQWSAVLEACETQLSNLTSKPERLLIFEAMADVFEHHLTEPARARAVALRAILSEGPDPRLVRRVGRLASLTGSWADTMAQLSRGAVKNADPKRQSLLFGVMGTYYLERLDQPHHAVTCFGQALLRDSKNSHCADSILKAILACLERGRLDELCTILPRLNPSVLPPTFVDRLAEHAQAMHRRGETQGCRRLLITLLRLAPEDETLFSKLSALLESEVALDELAALHEERLSTTQDVDKRRQRQLELVALYENILDRT